MAPRLVGAASVFFVLQSAGKSKVPCKQLWVLQIKLLGRRALHVSYCRVFYFTFKGKLFVKCLPFQGLASLEKVNNIFYLFHQFIKN